jgi:phage tail tape-measure protein
MAESQRNENAEAGKVVGLGAGAVAGAQLGTALIPIPVVGTFTGAVVGGILGSKVGQQIGGAILDVFMPPQPGEPANPDLMAQLERLNELHRQGVLTEEEFKAAKAKLLGL